MVKTVACLLTPEQVERGTLGVSLNQALTLNRGNPIELWRPMGRNAG